MCAVTTSQTDETCGVETSLWCNQQSTQRYNMQPIGVKEERRRAGGQGHCHDKACYHNHHCSWCARCQFTYFHRFWASFNAGNLAINLLKRNGLQSRTFYLTSTACVRLTQRRHFGTLFPRRFFLEVPCKGRECLILAMHKVCWSLYSG